MTLDLHAEYQRADPSLASSRPAEAVRILEPVRAADPADRAVLELLARAYCAAAQLARAEDALTALVELAPSDPWARRAPARTLERRSRGDAAAIHHRIADALGAARPLVTPESFRTATKRDDTPCSSHADAWTRACGREVG